LQLVLDGRMPEERSDLTNKSMDQRIIFCPWTTIGGWNEIPESVLSQRKMNPLGTVASRCLRA